MKKQIFCVLIILLVGLGVSAQTIDKSVEQIRSIYTDVSEKARLAESDKGRGEFGDLVMNELTINKSNHQWRSVGVFRQTYKFFYKGGDSEEHMYPDQLVMVRVERRESDRSYVNEYLFGDSGELLFYFQKAENDKLAPAERRVYFADGPDLDIFPKRYGAHTVTQRAGMQLRLFNHGLYVLARLKRHHRIADLTRHTGSLMKVSKMFMAQGDASGGLRVAVRGEYQGQGVTHHAFLVVRGTHGIAIPASPVVALIRQWVNQGVSAKGAVACVGLVTLDQLRRELMGYDISLVYA